MSRQNKVNPGQYTQRGRLTQDDAAREIARQRSIGSQHTWQPVQKDQAPRLWSKDEDADLDDKALEETERGKTAAPRRGTTEKRSATKSKATKARTAKMDPARKATGKAKTRQKDATPAKATARKTGRTAILARNVGGGARKPLGSRPRAKR